MTAGSSKYLAGLIALNIAAFAIIAISGIFDSAFTQTAVSVLCVSDDINELLYHPWSAITYSIVQGNILQLIFNMIWLYGFGKLMLLRCSVRQFLSLYVAGAIVGATIFLVFFNISNPGTPGLLMGSSASVIAIATAVAIIMPDKEVYIPLLGSTKIKWVVIVVIALFCIGLSTPNSGGNLAHIGGAIAGAAYGLKIRNSSRPASFTHSAEYDRLVDKIKNSGYDSMTAKEKRRFFELSHKR